MDLSSSLMMCNTYGLSKLSRLISFGRSESKSARVNVGCIYAFSDGLHTLDVARLSLTLTFAASNNNDKIEV